MSLLFVDVFLQWSSVLCKGLHHAIMADINRFCLLSPDWKTFWARIFQTWIFFTGAKWVTLSFTAYNNQEIFFFWNKLLCEYKWIFFWCQDLQELGQLVCGFICTCSRGPDIEHLHWVFSKAQILFYLLSFFIFWFCWVHYSALFITSVCLCTQWLF